MDQEVINNAKKKLAELEEMWKNDLKKPHKGGLDSNSNLQIVKLKYLIKKGEEENNTKLH